MVIPTGFMLIDLFFDYHKGVLSGLNKSPGGAPYGRKKSLNERKAPEERPHFIYLFKNLCPNGSRPERGYSTWPVGRGEASY